MTENERQVNALDEEKRNSSGRGEDKEREALLGEMSGSGRGSDHH